MAERKKKKNEPKPHEPYKKEIETFSCPSAFGGIIERNEPSCFNGFVDVRKYRITIEMIDEPIEVIQQRIVDLWEGTYNHHNNRPLEEMAKRYSCEHLLTWESRGKREKEKR